MARNVSLLKRLLEEIFWGDDERLKRRDSIIKYIAPPENKKRSYVLKNGSQVVAKYTYDPCGGYGIHHFFLTFDNQIKFESNLHRNPSILSRVYVLDKGKWEELSNPADEKSWQRRYDDLVDKIYKTKSSFERCCGEEYDEKVVGGRDKE
ncbi:MAG: hypothetical protein Q8Q42_01425 [Nanoarchaeota archaeon]|nr:hypothetical protein [Nanoarchaeota archaeon]